MSYSQIPAQAEPAINPQLAEQIEGARQSWRLSNPGRDPAEFEGSLQRSGLVPNNTDPRNPAQRAWDRANGFAEQPQASDYQIDWNPAQRALSQTDLAEATSIITQALAATGLPPGIGSSIYEHARDIAASVGKADEHGRANWAANQRVELVKSAGSEEAANKLTAGAAAFLDRAARNAKSDHARGGIEMLRQSLGAKSAWAIRTLANFGAHTSRWEQGRPG